jgi:hypothetical protein
MANSIKRTSIKLFGNFSHRLLPFVCSDKDTVLYDINDFKYFESISENELEKMYGMISMTKKATRAAYAMALANRAINTALNK